MPKTLIVPHTDAGGDVIERYRKALARRDRAARVSLDRYWTAPQAFARDCIDWGEDGGLKKHQEEMLEELGEEGRIAGRGPHGIGKTTIEAIATLWYSVTRSARGALDGEDWKVVTTAGAWGQLEHFLWPEIHKWAKRLRWERLGRSAFNLHELLQMELNLTMGSAFARSSTKVELIEGAHATRMLYIFDEAKAIPDAVFDAAEGATTGEGGERTEFYAMAMSTPGEPIGRFYDIHTKKKGYTNWATRHVTKDDAIESGTLTQEFVDLHADMWGENSAIFHNRVLGEFYAADEDGVIPLSWIEKAVARWEANRHLHEYDKAGQYVGPVDRLGVDVARMGSDKTILALRYGNRICELRDFWHKDTMETAGNAIAAVSHNKNVEIDVDTDGLGAGVTDRLKELGFNVFAFHAGMSTDKKDRTGQLEFKNVRSAAWWNVREVLDPRYELEVELPPDDQLIGELCAPKWKMESNGKLAVEKKLEVVKRIGRSTDRADGVMHSFWEERKKRRARMHYEKVDWSAAA